MSKAVTMLAFVRVLRLSRLLWVHEKMGDVVFGLLDIWWVNISIVCIDYYI